MRVHLLLILFFASTVLARARIRRDTNVTTVDPSSALTTDAIDENTTTDIDTGCGDRCGQNASHRPSRIVFQFIREIILAIHRALMIFMEAVDRTGAIALRITLEPFVGLINLMIVIIKKLLSFI